MAATCSGDALLYVRLEPNFYILFKFHAKVRYLELKKSFTSYLRYGLYKILVCISETKTGKILQNVSVTYTEHIWQGMIKL